MYPLGSPAPTHFSRFAEAVIDSFPGGYEHNETEERNTL